jgi:hypothetical protein
MSQESYLPGTRTYRADFRWGDEPGCDRLVTRVQVLRPGSLARRIYCVQEVYWLTP